MSQSERPGGDGSRQPMDKTQQPKEMMKPEQALEFVRNGMFELTTANRMQARCVDGRYNGEAEGAARSMPGADAGLLMAGLAATRNVLGRSLTRPERARVDVALKEFLKSVGATFAMHSDTHGSDQDNVASGCKHCLEATQHPEEYDLEPLDATCVLNVMALVDAHGKAQLQELEGDHDERAVIVVHGNRGVLSKSRVDGVEMQAFVLQIDLQDKALDGYAQLIAAKFNLEPDAVIQSIHQAAQLQLNATLGKVAVGRPIYEVDINGQGEVTLTQAA